jgi:formylglycine-generating enzyme required for sulfatase activity
MNSFKKNNSLLMQYKASSVYDVGPNAANYNSISNWNGTSDGNVTTVGSNGGPSAYGTYDQSGQVFEWNDLVGSTDSSRGLRGGSWGGSFYDLRSLSRTTVGASFDNNDVGFRIASLLNPLNLSYFVSVVDANNSSDPSTGYGSVSYNYQISQYLITNCEYVQFLNAIAVTDTYGLYNSSMASVRGGITRSGSNGSYSYSVKTNYSKKPVIWVNWFDCARYCNWLHNGKPNGAQNSGTTENGAYNLSGATGGNAPAKNPSANYYIPTENEWYKAAYYKGGGTNSGYWTYSTQSNTAPTAVTSTSIGNGPYSTGYNNPLC